MSLWESVPDAPEDESGLYSALGALLPRIPENTRKCFPDALFMLETDADTLAETGLDEDAAFLLSAVPRIVRYEMREKFGAVPCLTAAQSAAEYLKSCFVGVHVERFYAVFLDAAGRLIETVLIQEGSDRGAAFRMKQLLISAVSLDARALILCHNHPRGTPAASDEDIACTLEALRLLPAVGVTLLDHIIAAGNETVSLRATGAIPEEVWRMQAPDDPVNLGWLVCPE